MSESAFVLIYGSGYGNQRRISNMLHYNDSIAVVGNTVLYVSIMSSFQISLFSLLIMLFTLSLSIGFVVCFTYQIWMFWYCDNCLFLLIFLSVFRYALKVLRNVYKFRLVLSLIKLYYHRIFLLIFNKTFLLGIIATLVSFVYHPSNNFSFLSLYLTFSSFVYLNYLCSVFCVSFETAHC